MSAADQIPRDGREVQVRIGRRTYAAAWAYDTDTGEEFLGVKLNGADWVRVSHDVIEEILPAKRPARLPCGQLKGQEGQRLPCGQPERQERQAKGQEDPEIEEVTRRVWAMVRTLQAMPDIEARFLTAGKRINWPETVYTAEDLRAQDENHDNRDSALARKRHKATPRDIAQLDETWGWFSALDPLSEKDRKYLLRGAGDRTRQRQVRNGTLLLSPPQRLIWRYALGDSFNTIAKDNGENHETIRRRYKRAIERLAAIASGSAARKERRSAVTRRSKPRIEEAA